MLKRFFNLNRIMKAGLLLSLIPITVVLYAQTEPDPAVDIQAWLHYKTEALYGAIIVLGGYLSKWFPVIGRWHPTFRVLSWAAATGLMFTVTTPMNAINASVTYAITTSIYEVILKWIKRTPEKR